MSNKPVATFRSGAAGGVSIAIWENGDNISCSISKQYLDGQGVWQTSNSLWSKDLAGLLVLIPRAIGAMDQLKAKKSKSAKKEAPAQPAQQSFQDDEDIPF